MGGVQEGEADVQVGAASGRSGWQQPTLRKLDAQTQAVGLAAHIWRVASPGCCSTRAASTRAAATHAVSTCVPSTLQQALDSDAIVEPVRGPLIPGFAAVKEAARAAGARPQAAVAGRGFSG